MEKKWKMEQAGPSGSQRGGLAGMLRGRSKGKENEIKWKDNIQMKRQRREQENQRGEKKVVKKSHTHDLNYCSLLTFLAVTIYPFILEEKTKERATAKKENKNATALKYQIPRNGIAPRKCPGLSPFPCACALPPRERETPRNAVRDIRIRV